MTALFTVGYIGGVEIRNRIVMPPMTTRLADAEGCVTDATIAYYRARALGGVGLITVEMASPEKAGRHRMRELGIYGDMFLPGLKSLVERLHDCGAKVSIQLGHGGGHTREDICGEPPIAPSAVPHAVFEVTNETIIPLEMTRERIEQTTRAFVAAAQRAQQAGFDCVELHAAHGYLISQFLCPEENRRTDEYGGSLENRARFGLDILRRTKREAPGLPVIFRLSVDDLFPTGMPFSEGLKVAKWAAEAGADAIHVSAGHYRSLPSAAMVAPPMICPDATFLDYAEQVKLAVDVPVIAVGRLDDPATAMAAVDAGKTDFVALGRSVIADPDWVDKAEQGLAIRRCLACNTCINEMRGGAQLGCLINPVAGHELEFSETSPPRGRDICVIGAGPAGLCYAQLVADGNKVTVIEHEPVAGGAFRLAAKAPTFQEVETREACFQVYLAEMERACREAGVEFRYGVDITRNPEALEPFELIVFATGARYGHGLGALAPRMLGSSLGRTPPARRLFASQGFKNWFYYRARTGTGARMLKLTRPGQEVVVIGDAARAGKGGEAISDAFRAALFGQGRRAVSRKS